MLPRIGNLRFVSFSVLLVSAFAGGDALSEPSAQPVPVEAHFSKPNPTSSRLEDLVVSLIQRAAPGSEIRASLYEFASDKVLAALEDAKYKKVRIRIVLDDSSRSFSYNSYRKAIRRIIAEGMVTCYGGACVGSNNNHNKFWLFSRLEDPQGGPASEGVVLLSSENLNETQRWKNNNSILIRDTPAVYRQLVSYFESLASEVKNEDYMNTDPSGILSAHGGRVRVFVHPSLSTDPVLDTLRNTQCAAGESVRLVFPTFQQERAGRVLQELLRMIDTGCDIRFITRRDKSENEYIGAIQASRIQAYSYTGWTLWDIHSKYVLIDARVEIGGELKRRQLVITGSSNLTENSLRRNDEISAIIEDAAVHSAFSRDFEKTRKDVTALN